MKKFIIFVIVVAVLAVGGMYGYKQVKAAAAEKIIDQVQNNVSDADIQKLKEDPDIKKLLENANADALNLPVKTKEEAVKMIAGKLSISDIKDMASMAADGLTEDEKAELKAKMEKKFTPEELDALKAIAVKQLNQ